MVAHTRCHLRYDAVAEIEERLPGSMGLGWIDEEVDVDRRARRIRGCEPFLLGRALEENRANPGVPQHHDGIRRRALDDERRGRDEERFAHDLLRPGTDIGRNAMPRHTLAPHVMRVLGARPRRGSGYETICLSRSAKRSSENVAACARIASSCHSSPRTRCTPSAISPRVRPLEEDACHVRHDRVEVAAPAESGDRLAERGGLDRSQAEILARGRDEPDAMCVEPPQACIGHLAEQPDVARQRRSQRCSLGALADDDEALLR